MRKRVNMKKIFFTIYTYGVLAILMTGCYYDDSGMLWNRGLQSVDNFAPTIESNTWEKPEHNYTDCGVIENRTSDVYVNSCNREETNFCANPQVNLCNNPYIKPQLRPYDNTDVNSYAKPQLRPYNNTDVNSYAKPQLRPYDNTDVNSYAKPQLRPYNNTDVNSYVKPQLRPYDNTDVNSSQEYFIQVGAFRVIEHAEQLQASLIDVGKCQIQETDSWYKVQFGPYSTRAEIKYKYSQLKGKVTEIGLIQKGVWTKWSKFADILK